MPRACREGPTDAPVHFMRDGPAERRACPRRCLREPMPGPRNLAGCSGWRDRSSGIGRRGGGSARRCRFIGSAGRCARSGALHPRRGCLRRSVAGRCTRRGALHPQRGLPTACRGRSTPATGAKTPHRVQTRGDPPTQRVHAGSRGLLAPRPAGAARQPAQREPSPRDSPPYSHEPPCPDSGGQAPQGRRGTLPNLGHPLLTPRDVQGRPEFRHLHRDRQPAPPSRPTRRPPPKATGNATESRTAPPNPARRPVIPRVSTCSPSPPRPAQAGSPSATCSQRKDLSVGDQVAASPAPFCSFSTPSTASSSSGSLANATRS